jgi:hypothetical protein
VGKQQQQQQQQQQQRASPGGRKPGLQLRVDTKRSGEGGGLMDGMRRTMRQTMSDRKSKHMTTGHEAQPEEPAPAPPPPADGALLRAVTEGATAASS